MSNFIINLADLTKILEQIKIAEAHAAGGNLADIIGLDNQLLPMGLRTVDGSYNHLLPGQQLAGAADTLFPRLLDPVYVNDKDGDQLAFGPPGSGAPVITNTNYDPSITTNVNGVANKLSVADADPRIISNLIVDQTISNPAALAAALAVLGSANPLGDAQPIIDARNAYLNALPADQPAKLLLLEAAINDAGLEISVDGSITIPNRSPDIGLSPPNSGWSNRAPTCAG